MEVVAGVAGRAPPVGAEEAPLARVLSASDDREDGQTGSHARQSHCCVGWGKRWGPSALAWSSWSSTGPMPERGRVRTMKEPGIGAPAATVV